MKPQRESLFLPPDKYERDPMISEILKMTYQAAGLDLNENLDGKGRKFSIPRQTSMALARVHTKASSPMVVTVHNRKQHTSVLDASKQTEKRIKDPDDKHHDQVIELITTVEARLKEEGFNIAGNFFGY